LKEIERIRSKDTLSLSDLFYASGSRSNGCRWIWEGLTVGVRVSAIDDKVAAQ
jgi:hypothetical protein